VVGKAGFRTGNWSRAASLMAVWARQGKAAALPILVWRRGGTALPGPER